MIRIISGGQTGADQVGLFAAKASGIPTGGVACRDFMTVEGSMETRLKAFGLVDENLGYSARTKRNVELSDVTLIFASNFNSSGTKLTIQYLKKSQKPFVKIPIPESGTWKKSDDVDPSVLKLCYDTLNRCKNATVNIAGNSTLSGNDLLVPYIWKFLVTLFNILGYKITPMAIFETPTQFSLHIEDLAEKTQQTYLETIAEFCDENLVEYDDVVKMISPVLKQKIKEQSRVTYAMKKETTFSLDDTE